MTSRLSCINILPSLFLLVNMYNYKKVFWWILYFIVCIIVFTKIIIKKRACDRIPLRIKNFIFDISYLLGNITLIYDAKKSLYILPRKFFNRNIPHGHIKIIYIICPSCFLFKFVHQRWTKAELKRNITFHLSSYSLEKHFPPSHTIFPLLFLWIIQTKRIL